MVAVPQPKPVHKPMTVPVPPPANRGASIMTLPTPRPTPVERAMANRRPIRDPRSLAETFAEGANVMRGVGAGMAAGIVGLPADITALLARDAPILLAKLAAGKELDPEENAFFRKITEFQEGAGAEAIMRNEMGLGALLDAPSDSDDALSRAGVNPFRQGAFVGEFVADPLAALKLLKIGAKTINRLQPSDAEVAAYDAYLGGRPTPSLPGPPEEILPAGPDFDVDQNLADLTAAVAEDAAARGTARADSLRGTTAEFVANEFDDHLNSPLVDEDALMDTVMSYGDTSAARVVADALGIPREDVTPDALFLIRGRNMGDFPRAPTATEPTPASEAASRIVSDTPQQGFTGTVDLPPADPDTGSQLMSTTALNQRVLDIDTTQPFAPVADADSVRVAASTTDPLREGRIADYSPLRQLIYSLPDDRPLSKAEILETLSLDRGSTAYQKSLRNDLKGSGFLEWLETHGADEMMRGTLEVKYEELAPQVRALNVVVGDGDTVQALFGFRGARLPHQGMQDSIPEEYVILNPDATTNRMAFTGQIYLSNPNSAGVIARTDSGTTGIAGIRTGRRGGIGDHAGMSASGGQPFVDAPYGQKGVPGYFAHLRYSVIEDSAGRKMLVYQEGQSSNVVAQNMQESDPINALLNIQRRLEKNLRQMRAPEFEARNLPEDIAGLDEAGIQQFIDSIDNIVTKSKQVKERYDREGIPSFGNREDKGSLLGTMDPVTGRSTIPRTAGFYTLFRQIDRAASSIYRKLNDIDQRTFLTPKMKEDAELIAQDGALYDALKEAEKSSADADSFANVIDRSGSDVVDIPELANLASELDARAPVAEMILAANDADTITSVFNFRSPSYNGSYQQRVNVITNSIRDTTDPDIIRKFNTAIDDRIDSVLTEDSTAVDSVDIIRMELGSRIPEETVAADAPVLREVFQRLFEARQNGMTPHEYFIGSGAADLNTLLTKDPRHFGYITYRGDPGDPLTAVNAAQDETDVSTEAADVFDFIVKEKLSQEEVTAAQNVAVPEGMTPKRFQELRKVFRAARQTQREGPASFETDTPFANTTHFETFVPRFLVQEARRMGLDGVIFPSSDDMLTAGRGSLSESYDVPKRARFKRQYGTHVDQGLKDMGVEVVDLPTILAKNQTTGNIEPMLHKEGTNSGRTEPIHTNARAVYFNNEANARASDPNKLIRRAKGGPVDLRPKKLIHSGIGGMARQVM